MAMVCQLARERLSGYMDGELSRFERIRVEHHLGKCVACAEEAHLLRQVVALLHDAGEVDVPADFRPALMLRLRQLPAPAPARARLPAWRRWGLPAVAAAAVAALAFMRLGPLPGALQLAGGRPAAVQPVAPDSGQTRGDRSPPDGGQLPAAGPGIGAADTPAPPRDGSGAQAGGPVELQKPAGAAGPGRGESPGAGPGQGPSPAPAPNSEQVPDSAPAPVHIAGGPAASAAPELLVQHGAAEPGSLTEVTYYEAIRMPSASDPLARVQALAKAHGATVTDHSREQAGRIQTIVLSVSREQMEGLRKALGELGTRVQADNPAIIDLTPLYNSYRSALQKALQSQAALGARLADPAADAAARTGYQRELELVQRQVSELTLDLNLLRERAHYHNLRLTVMA